MSFKIFRSFYFAYKSSFKTNNIRYILLYLVHAACELLIVIIDFSFGLVPDDGSSYVQHYDYKRKAILENICRNVGDIPPVSPVIYPELKLHNSESRPELKWQ